MKEGTAAKEKKQRAPYVRQPAEMTIEEFRSLQEGMAEKWPQPSWMETPSEKGHTCYRDETYMTITRWTASTQIQYRPHAKAPGSKSHVRYERYSKARTVAEALKLGSWPADWCWDYERGFIRVVGGDLREEPLDSSEVDTSTLDDVGKILARWFIREAAKILNMSLKELSQNKDAKDQLLLRMKRTVAENKAKAALEASRKIVDADVVDVLQSWGFRKNVTRLNVLPDGQNFVFSDTMGLITDRCGGVMSTAYTLAYPHVQRLLCQYLQDNGPEEVQKHTFTSINVNKNYAGRLHRDGNNVGPSVIKAFGDFTGGLLNYYPNDDRALNVEDVAANERAGADRVSIDLSKNVALFDGRRAHCVDDFQGERFSLVYFTCPRYWKVDAKQQEGLSECGFRFPSEADTEKLLSSLAPPVGYGAKPAPPSGPQFKVWPVAQGKRKGATLIVPPSAKCARHGA